MKDSIRIVTKFSEMEESYASLNSLRFVKYKIRCSLIVGFSRPFLRLNTSCLYISEYIWNRFDLFSRYDIIVDVAPEVKWNPENGYKNLKIIVEIDGDVNAEKAYEQELRRRHKSLGAMRIVTDRGLQVDYTVI